MGLGEQDVVLTLPASPEFGDVARLAVGELARRRGFAVPDGKRLEQAVTDTLELLSSRGSRDTATSQSQTGQSETGQSETGSDETAGRGTGGAETAEVASPRGPVDNDLGTIRFTFSFDETGIDVSAERTGTHEAASVGEAAIDDHEEIGAPPTDLEQLRSRLGQLVERPQIRHDGARVRFHKDQGAHDAE